MGEAAAGRVLVQVVSIDAGREIGWGSKLAERLSDRMEDLRDAIAEGTQAVADSLPGLPSTTGWRLGTVSASFGLALTAEAGVILSKASAGATFDVTVSFEPTEENG
jgi:hypothetical protein